MPVDIDLVYPSKLERSRVIAPGVVAGAGFWQNLRVEISHNPEDTSSVKNPEKSKPV